GNFSPLRSVLLGQDRTVIVHYHIYKNAGTSIDVLLQSYFGSRWGTIEGPYPCSVVRSEVLADYLHRHPRILALSSHQARLPVPQSAVITVYPMVALRHPIDRVESVYLQDRKTGGSTPEAQIAGSSSLAEYVEWRLIDGGPVIRDFQVVFLSNAHMSVEDPRS